MSTTTSKKTVRRNGRQESKARSVMAEERDIDESDDEYVSGVPVEGGDSQCTSQSQSQSQSQEDNQLEKMITDMMQKQHKRFNIAKSNLHKSYDKAVADTKTTIDTLFENHEAESAQAHETHIKRLQQLLAMKAEIEANMQAKVASLRRAYCSHAMSLQTVVLDRARQLN